jgi:hypothetical protein
LNVAVAASIVLHHFAIWAGYTEREKAMEKFVVAERPQRAAPRGKLVAVKNRNVHEHGPNRTLAHAFL